MSVSAENELLDLIAAEAVIDRSILTPDARLDSLGIASIDMVSIVYAVEKRFKVEIRDEDLADLETVSDLTRALGDILRKS